MSGAGVAGWLEPPYRAGHADAGDDLVVNVEDGCSHAGDADGRLLVLEGDSSFDDVGARHAKGSLLGGGRPSSPRRRPPGLPEHQGERSRACDRRARRGTGWPPREGIVLLRLACRARTQDPRAGIGRPPLQEAGSDQIADQAVQGRLRNAGADLALGEAEHRLLDREARRIFIVLPRAVPSQ